MATCDNCGKDISGLRDRDSFRIGVHSEKLLAKGRVVKDIVTRPPIEDLYFCGANCLKEWASKYL